uniref:Uncharacterized protein n=1 Tax=Monodelphis domestica TaxID=13616 RepID=A0A5F8GAI7_MONDO
MPAIASFEDANTEETFTCFHVTVYHLGQDHNQVFEGLKFCKREKLSSTEEVKFGQNPNLSRQTSFQNSVLSTLSQFSTQLFHEVGTCHMFVN